MVPLMSLLVPILGAAVLVFVASFVFHMLLPFHRKDWLPVPAEDKARELLAQADASRELRSRRCRCG